MLLLIGRSHPDEYMSSLSWHALYRFRQFKETNCLPFLLTALDRNDRAIVLLGRLVEENDWS